MSQFKKNNSDRIDPSPTPLLIMAPVLALALMLLVALMVSLIPAKTNQWTVMAASLYVVIMLPFLLTYVLRVRKASHLKKESIQNQPSLSDTIQSVADLPYFLLDPADNGTVKMMSSSLRQMIEVKGWTHNFALSDLTTVSARHIFANAICTRNDMRESFQRDYERLFPAQKDPQVELDAVKDTPVLYTGAMLAVGKDPGMCMPIGNRHFLMHATPLRAHGRPYCFVWLDDVTDFVKLWERDENEYPILAYVVLDNLEELAQYVGVNTRTASNKIEEILNDWSTSLNGLIREYDTDRYLLIFPQEKLAECVSSGFDILERVKRIEIGDNSVPPTISIGLASTKGSLKDRNRDATSALDMALQRGGDQVVLKTPEETLYFGGRSKTMEKDISRDLRVISGLLCKSISESDNILIMAHRYPDFDAIAASIGLAKLAMCVKGSPNNIHVVSDQNNDDFKRFRETLSAFHEYDRMFISGDAAQEQIRTNTLLIICDVNNIMITECPDLIRSASTIAIIDHHTKQAEFNFQPQIELIQPQASSASELVTSMIMQSPYYDKLTKEEATLLLAGIMLDTKNFINSTSWQTFETAQYLYTRNAHTDKARAFFRESIDDMQIASDFGTKARVYRGCIAVSWLSFAHPLEANDKIAASKAADKLLTIEGIRAAFALVKTDTGVVVSGRSSDPTISVGNILRELGGGGHFDSAGAQISSTSLGKVAEQLREAIDHYMDAVKKTDK